MPPSEKQLNYVDFLLFRSGSLSAEILTKKLPKNNKKYPNEKVDYTAMILLEKIKEKMSRNQVTYLVQLIQQYKFKDIEKLFKQVNII